MKTLPIEEIKKMVGTEFIYVFTDRDEIPAVIAAFDPKIGFTCLATSLETKDGYVFDENDLDENDNLCLAAFDARDYDFLEGVSMHVRFIKSLGYYRMNSYEGFGHAYSWGGHPGCSF